MLGRGGGRGLYLEFHCRSETRALIEKTGILKFDLLSCKTWENNLLSLSNKNSAKTNYVPSLDAISREPLHQI